MVVRSSGSPTWDIGEIAKAFPNTEAVENAPAPNGFDIFDIMPVCYRSARRGADNDETMTMLLSEPRQTFIIYIYVEEPAPILQG